MRPATVDAVQFEHGDGPDGAAERRKPRWPATLAIVAALIAAVPIVIGVALGAAKAGPAPARGSSFTPVGPAASGPPPATTTARRAARQPGVLVALLQHPTTMRTAPGGPALAKLPLHTEFGSPQAMW